jgi:hypothetical protein
MSHEHDDEILSFYRTPGRWTTLGERDWPTGRAAGAESSVPATVQAVVAAVQGLLIYDLVALPLYGVDLSPEQAGTIHERDTSAVLSVARSIDDRPLTEPRSASCRVGARCHLYSRLTVALLRAAGVAARARCGFAGYFGTQWLEDHWIAEYWNEVEQRWVMVDAQLDDVWRSTVSFEGDAFDISPEQFVTAGRAWQQWRGGAIDASRCGLSSINQSGPGWIAGNIRLDLASLNKVEMLPWDVWGEGFAPGTDPSPEQVQFFDELAEMTADPDACFGRIRSRYESDPAVRMDGVVFNVFTNEIETIT